MKDTICFSYKLSDSVVLKEHFLLPYSVELLKKIWNKEELNSIFDAPMSKIPINSGKYSEYINGNVISIEKIDENDGSIWINNEESFEENSLFDYYADILFVSALVNDKSLETVRIGAITELMKIVVDIFKINIFTVFHLESIFSNDEYKSRIKDFIRENIFPTAFLNEDEFSVHEEELDKDYKSFISSMCKHFETVFAFLSNPDDNCLQKLSKFISDNSLPYREKYIYKGKKENDGCFCIVKNAERFYFSFSGYDIDENCNTKQKYSELSKKVKNFLKKDILKTEAVNECFICPEMKSYGLSFKKDASVASKRILLSYPFSIKYCYGKNILNPKDLGSSYSCCERKIFVSTNNPNFIKVYCRWSPCEKCFPAVVDQINLHSRFKYWAFAKDFDSFKKNPFNRMLWSLIKTDIS